MTMLFKGSILQSPFLTVTFLQLNSSKKTGLQVNQWQSKEAFKCVRNIT